ncbi:hypothetical protein DV532_07110 [Pseudomonas sp. Leaf58]|nr:hypothetical protein DV532_07110 [Pseudomonas sp. Leaf58]
MFHSISRGRRGSSSISSHAPRLQPTWHRTHWPETDVGAGLPAKRRAGGARSTRQPGNPVEPYCE